MLVPLLDNHHPSFFPSFFPLGLLDRPRDQQNKIQGNMKLSRAFSSAVKYAAHGAPSSVLKRESVALGPLDASQVAVKLLGAPINPSDINQVYCLLFMFISFICHLLIPFLL